MPPHSHLLLFRRCGAVATPTVTHTASCTSLRCASTSSVDAALQPPDMSVPLESRYNSISTELSKRLKLDDVQDRMFSANTTGLYKVLDESGTDAQTNAIEDSDLVQQISVVSDCPKLTQRCASRRGILLEGRFGRFGGFIKPLNGGPLGQWCVALYHPPLSLSEWSSRYANIVPNNSAISFAVPMVAKYLYDSVEHFVSWTAVVFDSVEEVLTQHTRVAELVNATRRLDQPYSFNVKDEPVCNAKGDPFFTSTCQEKVYGYLVSAITSIRVTSTLWETIEHSLSKERGSCYVVRIVEEGDVTVGWMGHRDGMLVAAVHSNIPPQMGSGGVLQRNDAQLYEIANDGYSLLYTPLCEDLRKNNHYTKAWVERITELRKSKRGTWEYLDKHPTFRHCNDTVRHAAYDLSTVLRPFTEVKDFEHRELILQAANTDATLQDGSISARFGRKLLIPGGSGTGKTMAALTCLPTLLSVSMLFRKIPIRHTFSFYVKVAGLDPVEKETVDEKKVSTVQTAGNLAHQVNTLLTLCTEAMLPTLIECVKNSDVTATVRKVALAQTPEAQNANKGLFQVTLDEMSPWYDVVRTIMNDDAKFEMGLRAKLHDALVKRFPEQQQLIQRFIGGHDDQSRGILELVFAVVGTGVGAANVEKGQSLPKTYITVRYDKKKTAEAVFVKRLRQRMKDLDEAYKLKLKKPLSWNRFDGNLSVVKGNQRLSGFLTNARCAAALADRIIEMCLESHMLTDELMIQNSATSLAISVANFYIQTNGWQYVSKNEEDLLDAFSCLINLATTQPHGFHTLSDEMLSLLRSRVGAIEDHLQFDEVDHFDPKTNATQNLFNDADPELTKLFEAAGAHRVVPEAVQVVAEGNKERWRVPVLATKIRFEVNPAVLLVAVVYKAGVLQPSAQHRFSSGIYEMFVGHVVSLQHRAWHYHLTRAKVPTLFTTVKGTKRNYWKLPLRLLFPCLKDDGKMLRETTDMDSSSADAAARRSSELDRYHSALTLYSGKYQMKILSFEGHTHHHQMRERVDEIISSVKEFGTVLEFAGNGTPRCDITLYSYGVVFGIACKEYYGKVVDAAEPRISVPESSSFGATCPTATDVEHAWEAVQSIFQFFDKRNVCCLHRELLYSALLRLASGIRLATSAMQLIESALRVEQRPCWQGIVFMSPQAALPSALHVECTKPIDEVLRQGTSQLNVKSEGRNICQCQALRQEER